MGEGERRRRRRENLVGGVAGRGLRFPFSHQLGDYRIYDSFL